MTRANQLSPAIEDDVAKARLSVVIPTRNEAANVPVIVDRIKSALPGLVVDLCFVDDSDDDTPAVLERLAEADPHVRCLLRQGADRAGGLSTAVVAGLHMATADYVCVMDADLQHPPELIPRMLELADGGADLVVASRYTQGGSQAGLDGASRRMISRGATTVARLIFEEARRSADPLSGYFLCRRALIDGVEFRPVGFKILLELLVLLPPDIEVRDIALEFQPRAEGQSKANVRQGLLYLRHLRSLFLDVKGSARTWKFAIVGGSGLLIFLPVLALFDFGLELPPLLSFLPAFAVSVAWNTTLNRVWTFADQRRRAGGSGPGRYFRTAVISGGLMFLAYSALYLWVFKHVIVAGALAALVGMTVNGLANWRSVHRGPKVWAEVAVNSGVQVALGRLAEEVGADRAYVLPTGSRGPASGSISREVLNRAAATRRPALWTEAASHRLQRRSSVAVSSFLILPVVSDRRVLGIVVCERHAPRGFDDACLQIATAAVDGLADALSQANSFVANR
ncbi:MAG TPA: glycosyltransferase [Candidatus Dormibacteraeota bacterium]|jgi:dolichol-phosphate mannosyltransferase|nr:glycosyltransferase [Candidatus Dormibacteraeota bacterium]